MPLAIDTSMARGREYMGDPEPDEANDEVAVEVGAENAPQLKGRRSFSSARRELTEEELGHPAVQKMMMDELDRLDGDNTDLKLYVDRFHVADKSAAILLEKQKRATASEIIYGAMMTVGAAAIGYSPSAGEGGTSDPMILGFGVILVVAGVLSKVVAK